MWPSLFHCGPNFCQGRSIRLSQCKIWIFRRSSRLLEDATELYEHAPGSQLGM